MPKEVKMVISAEDKASKNIKEVSKTAESAFSKISVGALAVVAALAATARSLTTAAKKTIDYGDKLNKLHLQLGVSTLKLDKLRQVGQLAGVEFTQITTGIRMMQKALGDAANGTGVAKDAFNRLGLSINDLLNKEPAQAFTEIVSRLQKMKNITERNAEAANIFGARIGAVVLQMTDLKKSLDNTSSAMTEEATTAMATYNDNITKLKENLITGLIPALSGVVKGINEVIDTINTAPEAKIGFWEKLWYGPEGKAGYEEGKARTKQFLKDREQMIIGSDAAAARILNRREKALGLDKVPETKKPAVAVTTEVDTTAFEVEASMEALKERHKATLDWQAIEKQSIRDYAIWTVKQEEERQQKLRDTETAWNVLKASEMKDTWLTQANDKIAAAERANDAIENMAQKEYEQQKALTDRIEQGFSNAFNSVIEGTESVSDAFLKLAAQLAQVQLTKAATSYIEGLFSSANGNVFQNGRPLPFASGGVVSTPTIFPMANGGLGSMAEGGKPEAIMPLERGADGKLGVNAGGSGNNFYVQINAMDSKSIVETMRRNPAAIIGPMVEQISNGNQGLISAMRGAM